MTLNSARMGLLAVHQSLSKHELIHSDLQTSSVKRPFLGKLWVQIKKFFFAAKAYRLEAVINSIAASLKGEMRTQPAMGLSVVQQLKTRIEHIKKIKHKKFLEDLFNEKFNGVPGASGTSTAHLGEGSRSGDSPQGMAAFAGTLASSGLPTEAVAPSPQEDFAPPSIEDRRFYRANGHPLLQDEKDVKNRQAVLQRGLSDSNHHPESRQRCFDEIMAIYNDGAIDGCRPTCNRTVLREYVGSDDFLTDAQTVRIYYNGLEMTSRDAWQVAWQREPVNLFASNDDGYTPYFDRDTLQKAVGHYQSAYNDEELRKEKGSFFRDLPNSVSIYAQTPLWRQPGDRDSSIHVACLSVPAPALDDENQPHYSYYMSQVSILGSDARQWRLDVQKYRREMDHLAKVVVQATLDNREGAFNGRGIQRLVVTRYGQANFLCQVTNPYDKQAAKEAYYASLREEILRRKKELGRLPIVISEYGSHENHDMQQLFVAPLQAAGLNVAIINGDILKNAKEGDLIVNAWDPHSLPGNGNDTDRSLDGVLGMSTAIGCTQNPWINGYMTHQVPCMRQID